MVSELFVQKYNPSHHAILYEVKKIQHDLPISRENVLLFLNSQKTEHFPEKGSSESGSSVSTQLYQILASTGENVTEQLLHRDLCVRERKETKDLEVTNVKSRIPPAPGRKEIALVDKD